MMNNLILIGFFICLVYITILIIWIKKIFIKSYIIYKYENYINLFNFFLEESYDTIHKEQILRFFANGENLTKIQMENVKRLFIHDVIDNMGKNNVKIFVEFFGSYETFILNITNYVQKRIDNDEIKKLVNQKGLMG